MVEVTDEDREAAADILDSVSGLLEHEGIGQVADLIRDGEYDEHDVAIRVARHREEAARKAREEAALMARAKIEALHREQHERPFDSFLGGRVSALEQFAADLESLSQKDTTHG